MRQLITTREHPKYQWIPEVYQDEFKKKVIDNYLFMGELEPVHLSGLLSYCEDFMIKVHGYNDTEGRDPEHHLRAMESLKESNDEAWMNLQFDLHEVYFDRAIHDMELLLRKEQFTFSLFEAPSGDEKEMTLLPTLEVW